MGIHRIKSSRVKIERQKTLPITYKGKHIDSGYRIDLLVKNKLIAEFKDIEKFHNIHLARALTYLKLADCKLDLLLNSNVKLLKNDFTRIANNL
ncbi:MAG: GxxExxY protein [Marinifilaceae bacterium]